MGRIGLTLNEIKTRIVDGHEESFDFLGYTYGPERHRKDGHWYLSAKPSKKSRRPTAIPESYSNRAVPRVYY